MKTPSRRRLPILLRRFLAGAAVSLSAVFLCSPVFSHPSGGNPEHGRSLFNGKGLCFYCHGQDGIPTRRPALNEETASLIARLDPAPSDLRRAGNLKLRHDRERSRLIREGHTGTGMFPDATLTDDEIKDLLAYLARLRAQDPATK